MHSLTDLPGPRDFDALIAREELRRARTAEILTVAILDVDGLTDVNALHGSAAGTQMLALCVSALQETVRGVDEVAHTGADEFSALLHATDAKRAVVWAERFEAGLEDRSGIHPAGPITCSIGLADTARGWPLMEATARARRRMQAVQAVRKLRRLRDAGA